MIWQFEDLKIKFHLQIGTFSNHRIKKSSN